MKEIKYIFPIVVFVVACSLVSGSVWERRPFGTKDFDRIREVPNRFAMQTHRPVPVRKVRHDTPRVDIAPCIQRLRSILANNITGAIDGESAQFIVSGYLMRAGEDFLPLLSFESSRQIKLITIRLISIDRNLLVFGLSGFKGQEQGEYEAFHETFSMVLEEDELSLVADRFHQVRSPAR